ncbi:MAG TPA: hypothetical protein VMU75_07095 [Acidimicrobiales bacterium]|nr:hypothetical protein [Acidimicrobiales bacterium]
MHATGSLGAILAAASKSGISKHQIAGIVGLVVGLALVLFGGMRVAARVTGAAAIVVVGIVVLLLAVLLFVRAI